MSELRNRVPDRGHDQPATPGRPDTAQRGIKETAKSGAERLRALYGRGREVSPHRTAPRRPDALASHGASRPETMRRREPSAAHDARRSSGPADDRQATQHEDTKGQEDSLDQDEIDPSLLEGVARPHGALPDDAGRAYLTRPREGTVAAATERRADAARAGHWEQTDKDGRDRKPNPDRADRLEAWVDRPAFRDPYGDVPPPDRYGDPLTLPDGSRIPRFNDRPTREQTRQGDLRDCGIIAALGAVASRRPGDIARRVAIQADSTYLVRLNEARLTRHGAEATGRVVELTVTPDLPVHNDDDRQPAFAQAEDGAAWSPVLEKALAGVDQSWTSSRRESWAESWAAMCEADLADKDVKNPRSGTPPDGYVRLNQGSNAWDRAEVLTQLTGKESIVRSLPRREHDLTLVLVKQLNDRKPVLAASRPAEYKGEELPHNLEASHAYEVKAVRGERIILHNPWNHTQPEPMTAAEFALNMEPEYTTLK